MEHACTIIARNYLPAARVLAKSFNAHHPGGRFTVLVIDDLYREVDDSVEPFRMVRLDDLAMPEHEVHRMAMIYGLMELATALKPWFIQHLVEEGATELIYLDPDIQLFTPLDEVFDLASEHKIVVTPHVTEPMPRDGRQVDETAILSAGIYNLGFIAVDQNCKAFLRFWMDRLYRECLIDPPAMRFVDQRWIDFVPGMFQTHILRDPTYNVAYWNLDRRDLEWDGTTYLINGQPLRFFHFSGFDPRHPHLLSKHQGERPRVLLSERPAVARICAEYADALVANGFGGDESSASYGFDTLPNGVPLDADVRRLYREWLRSCELDGAPLPPDPFTADGAEAFISWINMPDDREGARLSRYLGALHTRRQDLQVAFAEPNGADYDNIVSWAEREAVIGRLHPRLVPLDRVPAVDASRPARQWARRDELKPGICVAAYFRAELGVGELGRLALAVARESGVETGTLVYDLTLSRQDHPFGELPRGDLNVNLVVVNADSLPDFAAKVGPDFFDGRYTIGLWAWELEEFPERFADAFNYVDEVWALSDFAQQAIASKTDKPVHTFPVPIVTPVATGGVDRGALGLPDSFLFLFCFDLFSVFERKNPLGLIDAFARAFSPGEGPTLVIKAINGDKRLADLERLKIAAAERPDVMIIDRYLDPGENAALMANCDCYVSLHRSEGLGLTMAEAMALSKPVIATAYSGNLDFMEPDTSLLVPWVYGAVPAGCEPYREGSRWAEPDLEAAARLMREVVERPHEAAELGERARRSVAEQHSVAKRVEFFTKRFMNAQQSLADPERLEGYLSDPQRASNPSVSELANSRPAIDSPSSHPRLVRPLRRIIARLTRHQEDHRRRVDSALADELLAVSIQVANVQDHLRQFEAERGTGLALRDLRLAALTDHVAGLAAATDNHIARAAERDRDQASAVTQRVDQLDQELHAVPFMSDPSLLATRDDQGRPAIGYDGVDEVTQNESYLGFEAIFRGPESFIGDRQVPYLGIVRGHEPVIDIGCGRGEFLDLLKASGLEGHGVDIDTAMVARCQSKGHTVFLGDALSFLTDQVDESIGTVFSAQVIEHLPPQALLELLRQARRVLRGDGVFIAETVNPHSVPAFKTFWTDLTHRAPIFPEVAVALCRQAGFERALVMFPNGTGELESDRRSQGEYAVVAWKKSQAG